MYKYYDWSGKLGYENPVSGNGKSRQYRFDGTLQCENEIRNSGVCEEKCFYYSGQISYESRMENCDWTSGKLKSFYPNGKLRTQEEMIKGQRQNLILYDENGRIFKDGVLNGYSDDGKLQYETRYADGQIILEKELYPDGQIESEMPYKNGKREGVYKYYNHNGTVDSWINYKNGEVCSGKRNDEFESEESTYENCDFEHGIGYYKYFYKNGNLKKFVKKRKFDVIEENEYYPDGKMRLKSVPSNLRDKDAIKLTQIDSVSDKVIIVGYEHQIAYDEQGNVLKNGLLKEYSLDGIHFMEIPYQNGKPNGSVKGYDNGTIQWEAIYKDGVRIRLIRYYPNGKISYDEISKIGQKLISKEYDLDGKLKSSPNLK